MTALSLLSSSRVSEVWSERLSEYWMECLGCSQQSPVCAQARNQQTDCSPGCRVCSHWLRCDPRAEVLLMCITSLNLHQYTLGYIFMSPFDKRGSWGTDCKRQRVRGKTEIQILVRPPSTISEIACLADKSHLPWTLFPKVHLKMLRGDSRRFCSYRRLFWGVCWVGSGAKCT